MRTVRVWVLGVLLGVLVSCSTMKGTPEVIVILPEGEGQGDVGKVSFSKQIKPILVSKCLACHHPNSDKTDISFATRDSMLEASKERPILVPGEPEKSTLFLVTVLPDYFVEAMPASGHKLSEEEKWNLYHWIQQGADWPKKDSLVNAVAAKKKG